jgi:hypothetical protein
MLVYCDLFIAAHFQEMLVPAPWRQGDNSAETYSSYVKDGTNKLQNSAFAGITCTEYKMYKKQLDILYIFSEVLSLYSVYFYRKAVSPSQNIQRRILGWLVNRELQSTLKEACIICVAQCITRVHRNSTGKLSEERQKYWSVRRYDRLLFKTQQVLGWICAVPLYALTHNQQFRRSVLNFAVTLQRTLWTFPLISSFAPSLLSKFITSLVLGFTVEGHTTTSIRKNVSDIQVKEYRQFHVWVSVHHKSIYI